MHQLKKLILEKVSSGLKRKTITTCSKWACMYRIMTHPFPGRWTFTYHPWLKEMHDDKSEITVGQKGAQVGFTEWAMNLVFYTIDNLNLDSLYVFPSNDDASAFSSGRFDPALENSPHLKTLFSDVKNVTHKRAGNNNLYIRGSHSRSKLKSIPCYLLIFDELDEMTQDNIPLALRRASGQTEKKILFISTPTVENFGINARFKESTQAYFYFKCPYCGKFTNLTFPECLVITAEVITDPKLKDSYYICKECKHKLNHETKFEWLKDGVFVPTFKERGISGYTISQLYSSTVGGRPEEIALSALKAELNPTEATEFYNSDLGQTYEAKGARVTDLDIINCTGTYREGPGSLKLVTMGVDVGNLFHYEINEWILPQARTPGIDINDEATCRLLVEGTCKDTIDLLALFNAYKIVACVIDRYPEQRIAYQFATKFWGRILLCMYGRGLYGKQVQMGAEEELTITVDRTAWLDQALSRFKNQTISLPIDLSVEYKRHIKEPVRVYKKDNTGNPIGKYVSAGDDHFAHTRNYNEIALLHAISFGQSHNIARIR